MKDYSHWADIDTDKNVPLDQMPLEQLAAMKALLETDIKEAQTGGTFLGIEFPPDPTAEAHHKAELSKLEAAIDKVTEASRKARIVELNESIPTNDKARLEALQAHYGRVWTTAEMMDEFIVIGFAAPYVAVKRRDTGEKGSLEFTHSPRFYFNYVKD